MSLTSFLLASTGRPGGTSRYVIGMVTPRGKVRRKLQRELLRDDARACQSSGRQDKWERGLFGVKPRAEWRRNTQMSIPSSTGTNDGPLIVGFRVSCELSVMVTSGDRPGAARGLDDPQTSGPRVSGLAPSSPSITVD